MFRMLKILVSVPIVMVCAAAGTAVLIKAIEKIAPVESTPKSSASVQILREHGKSDEEIRSMMLNDFHIEEKTLDEILGTV